MKKSFTLIILWGVSITSLFSQQWQWAIGSNTIVANYQNSYYNIGTGIEKDSYGNVYTVGTCNDSTYFGNIMTTQKGVFILKSDTLGNILWIRQIDSAVGPDITIDLYNNIYVAGRIGQDEEITIAKYDTSGNLIWQKFDGILNGGFNSYGKIRITSDLSGNFYLTSGFYGIANFSGTNIGTSSGSSIFIAKYDSAGNILNLTSSISTAYNFTSSGITIDANNNIYITGSFEQTVTFGVISISTLSNGLNDGDIFIAKYDSSFTVVWVKKAGGIFEGEIGSDLALDINGNIFLTGACGDSAIFGNIITQGVSDSPWGSYLFWAKYDNAGNPIWVKTPQKSDWSMGGKIGCDELGNIYISFLNYDDSLLINNYFYNYTFINMMKTDMNGSIIWIKDAFSSHLGGFCCEQIRDFIHYKNSIYLTGNYQDSAVFTPFTIMGKGIYSVFITKLSEENFNFLTSERIENEIIFYPNPAGNAVTVTAEKGDEIKIFDLMGREIKAKHFKNSINLSTDEIAPGVYFLSLYSNSRLLACEKLFIAR